MCVRDTLVVLSNVSETGAFRGRLDGVGMIGSWFAFGWWFVGEPGDRAHAGVPVSVSLGVLHEALLVVFDWSGECLHEFVIRGVG